jgi:hypothetical protein
MTSLGCSTDDVDCLIKTDAATLLSTFDHLNTWKNPTCRDGCQISPAVDNKVVQTMLGGMSALARRIPIMQGWCQDDGAQMLSYDVSLPQYTMTEA